MTRHFIIALVVVFTLFFRCGFSPSLSGTDSGSETTNGIVMGNIMEPQVRVFLIPEEYNPLADMPLPDRAIDTTDEEGNFSISVPDSSVYNIQAVNLRDTTILLHTGITSYCGQKYIITDTLRKPGSIKVPLSATLAARGYVFIPGTTIGVYSAGSGNTFVLNGVPSGTSMRLAYADLADPITLSMINGDLQVNPGDTVTVVYPFWAHTRNLYLNTTSSGANVSSNIVRFPVLVRLNRENFDFSEARPDGADVRFTKQNGTPLPYEIERWDLNTQSAEMWVKVDTVFGNSASHFITMYWGKGAVGAANTPSAVFDTADDFQAAWHLHSATTEPTLDATANKFTGTPSTVSPSAVPGIIGTAQQFNGASTYFEMTGTASGPLNFPQNGFYTVSAWVFLDSIPEMFDHTDIISKGNRAYHLQTDDTLWQFAESQDRGGWDCSRYPALFGKWTYLVGQRAGARQFLYVDGICVDSVIYNRPDTVPRDNAVNINIGRVPGHLYYFAGIIDEVRISSVVRSADWERLSYMNQKEKDALVVFQ